MPPEHPSPPKGIEEFANLYLSPSPSGKRAPLRDGFPSDDSKALHPDLGVLVTPRDSLGELLGIEPSNLLPQVYVGGLKILTECPEFRLLQYHSPNGPLQVESNREIRRRYLKSVAGINDDVQEGKATTWQQRTAWALALESLSGFTQANRGKLEEIRDSIDIGEGTIEQCSSHWSSKETATLLGSTLGLAIQELWGKGDRDVKLQEIVGNFETALKAFARSQSLLKDRRRDKARTPRPHDAIEAARKLFKEARVRPSKAAVTDYLKKRSLSFSGKNAKANWTDLFNASGLRDLPTGIP